MGDRCGLECLLETAYWVILSKVLSYLPKNPTVTALGKTGQLMETLVTIPRVPSDPINKCFKWYPVLSFFIVVRQSITVPSAFT